MKVFVGQGELLKNRQKKCHFSELEYAKNQISRPNSWVIQVLIIYPETTWLGLSLLPITFG